MSRSVLRLGTRKSPMAVAQSGQVAKLITARTGIRVELVGLTSFGDVTRAHLPDIGGTGVFVSALRVLFDLDPEAVEAVTRADTGLVADGPQPAAPPEQE